MSGALASPAERLTAPLRPDGVRTVYHATGDAFSAYGGASWATAVQAVRRH